MGQIGRLNSCCPCPQPALPPPAPSARGGQPGPPATDHAAGSITSPRTRVSGVSLIAFAGADQVVTSSLPFARHFAAR